MNKPLTYEEYQEKLKSVSTPEEAQALVQQMLMPMLGAFAQPSPSAETEEEDDEEDEALPRKAAYKPSKKSLDSAPWYDALGNDTDAMVVSLYAKGLTTRDIAKYMNLHHGTELSQPAISAITEKVMPFAKEWQSRALSSCYPVVYLDGLHFKVRDAGKIVSKCAYIVLGINQYGQKEVLGIWISESEGAKFWMGVLNELKNRGVEDIIIACVDGLKGFPEAIKTIYPQAEVQLCIAHQIRHTVMFLPHKDRKAFCDSLKTVYTAPSEDAGRDALNALAERWPQYSSYLKSWENNWQDLATFFSYPQPIRRMIYTTNPIENLNRQFRKVTKTTTIFPHDDSLIKLLWLAQADISQAWILPLRNWGEIMAQLSILFPERVQF